MGNVVTIRNPFDDAARDVQERLISIFHCSPVKVAEFAYQIQSAKPFTESLRDSFLHYWNTLKLDYRANYESVTVRGLARGLAQDGLRHPKFAIIQAFLIIDKLHKQKITTAEVDRILLKIKEEEPTGSTGMMERYFSLDYDPYKNSLDGSAPPASEDEDL